MATKAELIEAVGRRYRQSGRAERSAILNEFVAVTGYHRKHAIRLLATTSEAQPHLRQFTGDMAARFETL